jgi:hypothetical protein
MNDAPPDRLARIVAIRRKIAEGTYETEQRLAEAVDRMWVQCFSDGDPAGEPVRSSTSRAPDGRAGE